MINKFVLDIGWKLLFKEMGISEPDLLKRAQLPEGMFIKERAEFTVEEYFRLWDCLGVMLDDPYWPLKFAQKIRPESFSPPLFAALCSPNLGVALQRLSEFKRLCGPMDLLLEETEQGLHLTIAVTDTDLSLPGTLVTMELVFLVHLARMATQERIVPVQVGAMVLLDEVYGEFFGVQPRQGECNSLCFSAESVALPFLTSNASMWSFFEPELHRRLRDLDIESPFSERVSSALLELLPSGAGSVEQVAKKLAVSRRTLQRKLQGEQTSFQVILQSVRTRLAKHYLENSTINGVEVSLLLGFESYNSFIRAFQQWTGMSPEEYRKHSQVESKTFK